MRKLLAIIVLGSILASCYPQGGGAARRGCKCGKSYISCSKTCHK